MRTPTSVSGDQRHCPKGLNYNQFHSSDHQRILVEHAVLTVFGIEKRDLFAPTRGRKHVALARQVAMYLANVIYGLNFKETGELFRRDRTTAAHACGVVEDLREDPEFDRIMQLLESITEALLVRHVR